MILTLQQFAAAMQCTLMTAEAWHDSVDEVMALNDISTPRRMAAFLAQTGHETQSLSALEENLNYSAQRLCAVWPHRFPSIEAAHYYEHAPERLANLVYADRMGNGPYESGDGWRYRGRGLTMLTGRAMYAACGQATGLPLLFQPELVAQPNEGAQAAGWFWVQHGCNALADADDFAGITRAINGGTEGAEQRLARYEKALEVFS
jgi:putative chitinase